MIQFTVYGRPQPQGSMKAFIPKGWTRPVLTSSNAKMKPWRQEVMTTIVSLRHELIKRPAAVKVQAGFYFERPKSLPKKNGNHLTKKPDLDKLARALLDCLSGVLIEDDAQVSDLHVSKFYGLPERVMVIVDRMEG